MLTIINKAKALYQLLLEGCCDLSVTSIGPTLSSLIELAIDDLRVLYRNVVMVDLMLIPIIPQQAPYTTGRWQHCSWSNNETI